MSRLSTRIVPAYAKLNLSLAVVARRGDGWHDIDSVLVPVDWHDLVGLSVQPAGSDSLSLAVDGPAAAGVPAGEANLTVRAARALRTLAGRPLAMRLWLSKSVPHGAGLGGGSADAAAVLRSGAAALASLGMAVDPERIAAAALEVGSDVPALLSLSAQRVRGRGDRLDPLTTPALDLAVASTTPSSTASTYAAVAADEIGDDGRSARLALLLESTLGALVCAGPLAIAMWRGWMGAGDVKLMAIAGLVSGAAAGWPFSLAVLLDVAVAGGVLALAWILAAKAGGHRRPRSVPYGVAIAAGTAWAFLMGAPLF